jgi:hypothetical protein
MLSRSYFYLQKILPNFFISMSLNFNDFTAFNPKMNFFFFLILKRFKSGVTHHIYNSLLFQCILFSSKFLKMSSNKHGDITAVTSFKNFNGFFLIDRLNYLGPVQFKFLSEKFRKCLSRVAVYSFRHVFYLMENKISTCFLPPLTFMRCFLRIKIFSGSYLTCLKMLTTLSDFII